MICEQCEYNAAEKDALICEECMDRNLPIAEGDLPGFRVTDDQDTNDTTSCTCDDEMCTSCLTFQRISVAGSSILAL